jgi:TolA-binding protein
MTPSDPTEPRALSALTELLRDAVKKPTAAKLDRGLQELRTRLAGGNVNRRRAIRWSVLAAAVVACGVLVAVGVSFHRTSEGRTEQPVSLSRIEGGKILDGGYLSESGNAGIKLFFDEGSEFELQPGTRGRLRALNASGALLAIEHGSASLRITHRREHRWSVEAGPFLVTVKGTDFSVLWDPGNEEFELRLRRGRVAVSGPVVGEGLALKPGQKLTVSLRKAETIITEERPDTEAGEAFLPIPSPTSEVSVAPPAKSGEPKLASAAEPQASPTASGAGTERRWREALANGQWDKILADAERDGIEATLEKASSDDLFALADAARYRRRAALARLTLLAHRRRFPSSPRSLDAIFLLGRVEELRSSGWGSAILRYEEYLSRAPTGTYAAEALGRKMVLTKEVEGPASARPIAAEYLRRFPEGSYAGAARALERTP